MGGTWCYVACIFLLLEDRIDVLGSTQAMTNPGTSEQGYSYCCLLVKVLFGGWCLNFFFDKEGVWGCA